MSQIYDVMYLGQEIGKAEVRRAGLYYHFQCRCQLPNSEIYILTVSCNETTRNLGVCVPMEDCFGLDTKVPIKHIGDGMLLFKVVPKHDKAQERFYPIKPDEPFNQWTALKNAYFCVEDNRPGICIRKVKD